jgi:hypothetical protein
MAFRVGQKVVCVDASAGSDWTRKWLIQHKVYTVSFISKNRIDVIGVRKPYGFWPHRFRPVVERKTDISIFTAMLNPSKRGAKV